MVQPSPSGWQVFLYILSYVATPIFFIVAAVVLIFLSVALIGFLNDAAADARSRRAARDAAVRAGLFTDTGDFTDDDLYEDSGLQEGRVVTTGRVSDPDYSLREAALGATAEDDEPAAEPSAPQEPTERA